MYGLSSHHYLHYTTRQYYITLAVIQDVVTTLYRQLHANTTEIYYLRDFLVCVSLGICGVIESVPHRYQGMTI